MSSGTGRFVSFRAGWVLIAIGLAFGAAAAFVLVRAVGPAAEAILLRDACATPCSEPLDLDAGHYVVFEQVGTSKALGPLSANVRHGPTITPADVSVTSPSGDAVDVGATGTSEQIDRNGTTYAGVVSFRVPRTGRYHVSIDAPSRTGVIVAPAFGETLVRALPGVAVAIPGAVVGMAGVVVLVLAWSTRRSTAVPS